MSLGPLMISLRGTVLEEDERHWLESPLVAGVILFSRNFESLEQLVALVADIHAIRDPELLVTVDQEGGRVRRFGAPFYALPPMRTLGHLYDEDRSAATHAAQAFGWVMAAELRAAGIDLSFAPVVDLDLGLADVIGDRALHESADAVARLAGAFMRGAAEGGMVSTAKHFPSHAGAHADSHTETAVDRRDYADLIDDLAPYRHLIGHGLHSVMVGHVVFPALDPEPASLSKWWIGTQLRGELGFSGAVISDDVSMAGAAAGKSRDSDHAGRALAALDAGCDLVLLCNVPDSVPGVLERLEGYSNPASQLRLMRLRGQAATDWGALHDSERWREAVSALEPLSGAPALELEG